MHMARKPKLPPEYAEFKESVEKFGLKVILHCTGKNWEATVIKNKHCIWHNGMITYDIPLDAFWTSKAWKSLGLSNEINQ